MTGSAGGDGVGTAVGICILVSKIGDVEICPADDVSSGFDAVDVAVAVAVGAFNMVGLGWVDATVLAIPVA